MNEIPRGVFGVSGNSPGGLRFPRPLTGWKSPSKIFAVIWWREKDIPVFIRFRRFRAGRKEIEVRISGPNLRARPRPRRILGNSASQKGASYRRTENMKEIHPHVKWFRNISNKKHRALRRFSRSERKEESLERKARNISRPLVNRNNSFIFRER